MAGLLYLDASAIVKLVVDEAEREALRDALRGRRERVCSALALVEVQLAAARRTPSPPPGRVDTILAGLALIPIDHATLEDAARLGLLGVRAVDAIHLATAQSLGEDLESVVAMTSGSLRLPKRAVCASSSRAEDRGAGGHRVSRRRCEVPAGTRCAGRRERAGARRPCTKLRRR